ncbi:hypothetical protein [Natronococcus roseus]|uniref:hypothetical protein n=1 Tax=Natronococcus roseus TaxID=1052014 RepID=UPI00374D06D0
METEPVRRRLGTAAIQTAAVGTVPLEAVDPDASAARRDMDAGGDRHSAVARPTRRLVR